MAIISLVLALTLTCVSSVKATAHDDWQLQVLYNTQVNLTCRDEHFHPEGLSFITYQWVLPSGEVISPSSLNLTNQYTFYDNGLTLNIKDVERHNFGIYLCLVMHLNTLGVHSVVRQGINLDGPFFGDLSEKYSPKAKIGLFAGLFIFVFMSMLCFNLDQFQERHDRPPGASASSVKDLALQTYQGTPLPSAEMSHKGFELDPPGQNSVVVVEGVANPAFEGDADAVIESEGVDEAKTSF